MSLTPGVDKMSSCCDVDLGQWRCNKYNELVVKLLLMDLKMKKLWKPLLCSFLFIL